MLHFWSIRGIEAAKSIRWGGLDATSAMRLVTWNPARQLGIEARVGSLEVGKDGDVALYDGDPFEYTSHCIGVVINGQVVSETIR